MNRSPLRPLFSPRAIALFGASPDAGSIGGNLAQNLDKCGFAGAIHFINPHHTLIGERPCHAALDTVSGNIDLALIATPAATIPPLLAACGQRGVKVAVIYATLSDTDRQAGLDQAITDAARAASIRLLGPGALGFIQPHQRLNATPFLRAFLPGNLALVCQSDAVCAGIMDWLFADNFSLSAVFAPGDECDLGLPEILDHLATDPTTESILLYLENIPDSRRFMSALRAAARAKPVVAVKAGHADDDAAADAALRRAGALRVRSVGDLFSAARALTTRQKPEGPRLVLFTNGNGPDVIATDTANHLGLELPPLDPATRGTLSAVIGATWQGNNPVDLRFDAGPERFVAALLAAGQDPNLDGLLLVIAPNSLFPPEATARAIAEAVSRVKKPVLACVLGESSVREARQLLTAAGIPVFRTPETAVTAFAFMADYSRNQRLLLETPAALSSYQAPDVTTARTLCEAALERGETELSPGETQRLLQCFQISCFRNLTARPEAGHRQLALRVRRDAAFGPVIELSPGGPGRELIPAGPVTLPPLNDRLIGDYTREPAIAHLLAATPSLPAVAVDALRRLLLRISELACELPWIDTLDIDPLIADDYAVRPVTARASLRPARADARYPHMAIRPYPLMIETDWQDRQGEPFRVRPIRPEDAQGFQAFVRGLSGQSRYFRFFSTVRELPARQLARRTQIDYDRELVLVATRPGHDGEDAIIGEAFYGVLEDNQTCEFGIVVADELAGRGIGSRIMHCLMDAARNRGMRRMVGEVLADNEPMQGMMEALGFAVAYTDNTDIMELSRLL